MEDKYKFEDYGLNKQLAEAIHYWMLEDMPIVTQLT